MFPALLPHCAAGKYCDSTELFEDASTPPSASIARGGVGNVPADFTWVTLGPFASTPGSVNPQMFLVAWEDTEAFALCGPIVSPGTPECLVDSEEGAGGIVWVRQSNGTFAMLGSSSIAFDDTEQLLTISFQKDDGTEFTFDGGSIKYKTYSSLPAFVASVDPDNNTACTAEDNVGFSPVSQGGADVVINTTSLTAVKECNVEMYLVLTGSVVGARVVQ
jgi:hypothetical protein